MEFKIVNAKNLKMELKKKHWDMAYLFTEILIISWHIDIKEALWEKPGQ